MITVLHAKPDDRFIEIKAQLLEKETSQNKSSLQFFLEAVLVIETM